MNKLTAEDVQSIFTYDSLTGILTRKVKTNSRVNIGDVVGSLTSDGYLRTSIKGKSYQLHRVAWLHFYGDWPVNDIDHINGNRTDNRIENLRDVPNAENGKNQQTSSTNKSGVNGVYWFKSRSKWRAVICVGGKKKHLGYFDNLEDAEKARRAADLQFGFHTNHGRANLLVTQTKGETK